MRLVLLLLLATLGAATADKPDKGKEREARAAYQRAMTHYHLGEFDPAIAEFRRAYELSNAVGLLFNLGQAHRLKKDPERALYFYQTFLRLDPKASNRGDVEKLIVEMKEATRAPAPAPPATTAPTPPPPTPAPAPPPAATP